MTTRAPARAAMAAEASQEPLSMTTTSPRSPSLRIVSSALVTQVPTVRSSSRQGMITEMSKAWSSATARADCCFVSVRLSGIGVMLDQLVRPAPAGRGAERASLLWGPSESHDGSAEEDRAAIEPARHVLRMACYLLCHATVYEAKGCASLARRRRTRPELPSQLVRGGRRESEFAGTRQLSARARCQAASDRPLVSRTKSRLPWVVGRRSGEKRKHVGALYRRRRGRADCGGACDPTRAFRLVADRKSTR